MIVADLGFCLCCFLEVLLIAGLIVGGVRALRDAGWMWRFGFWVLGGFGCCFLGVCGFGLLLWTCWFWEFVGELLVWVGDFRLGFCGWTGLVLRLLLMFVFAGGVLVLAVVWIGLLGFAVFCGVDII